VRDLSSERDPVPSGSGPAPLLSVVIPTFNVESFVGPCIDSIAGQAFRDIEIIVADGASTDDTRTVLEKRLPEDPRLAAEWAGSRIGPGRARNAGAAKAAGEYLWFVDADDLVASDSLTVISERLATHRPDVLLINHEELLTDGTRRPGQDDRLITGAGNEPFTIAQRPRMLDVRLVAWNKIVRREFFQLTGAEFAAEWPYEDVPVSCDLLLAAAEITVLDHVCYHYRRPRPGSATNAGKRYRHFTVFDAWRPILKRNRDKLAVQSENSPMTEEVYHTLFQRSIWHCSALLDTPGYIARADRRAFLDQLSALYAEYVPDGYRPPGGFRGIKFALIAKDSYLGYAALGPLNKARIGARRLLAGR
jgi:CDP-glycerol glycerophosphotransferase